MADSSIANLSDSLTGAAAVAGDLIVTVDVSDTTMGATGTNKKMTLDELAKAVATLLSGKDLLAHVRVGALSTSSSIMTFFSAATNDDPTCTIVQGRVATTGAGGIILNSNTVSAMAPATDASVAVFAFITARRTGGSSGAAGDSASYIVNALWKDVSGTRTAVGITIAAAVESQSAWNVTQDVASNNCRLLVNDAANNNVSWHCTALIQQLAT